MINHTSLVASIKQQIDDVLLPYASRAASLFLLDFPNYENVGDSAIYLGELEFFRKNLGKRPAAVFEWSKPDWDAIDRSDSDSPIFLNGGGNFGDTWIDHQYFRETVLRRYPKRLVVQLPQSIHYADTSLIERTACAIKDHGNFVLLVRDERSYELSRKNFRCEVHKCPDMAFYLGPMTRPVAPSHPLLLLMRTDREVNSSMSDGAPSVPAEAITADWLTEPASMKKRAKATAIVDSLSSLSFNKMALKERYFETLAKTRLRRGTSLLASADFVITDRLHAHILSLLMNVPHTVLDNSYGKVSGFMDLWTKDYEHAQRAPGLSAALEMWKSGRA